MLIRLLVALLTFPCLLSGQDYGVDKPYEETGTFFDFRTGEYLLVTREKGSLKVRYSNGVKPFEDLIVLSDSIKRCCCEHIKCHSYIAAFKTSRETLYRLDQNYWEGLTIACYDSKNKLINVFLHCSNEATNRPDPIRSMAEFASGTYYNHIKYEGGHILAIEMKNARPEFTLLIGTLRVLLIPNQYNPTRQMLTGKTSQGQEFSLRYHYTLPRNVSLKIANFKPYNKEQWFEFGNQHK